MKHIAFFRNVNQGQRGHPSTAQLLAALHEAGASNPMAFRSNGTVAFDADNPDVVVDKLLNNPALSGREVFVRPRAFLHSLLSLDRSRFGSRLEVTIFDRRVTLSDSVVLARACARGRCEVVDNGAGWALVLNHVERQSNGTPVMETVTGGPATSRSLATIAALSRALERGTE